MMMVLDLVRRVSGIVVIPGALFWSLQTLMPWITIHYTPATVAAFWLFFWILRWAVQNIRYEDWSNMFSIE
jgi:hypothetical protein